METTLAGFVVFAFCLIGCGAHCWHLGKQVGIKGAVNNLEAKGMIEVDDDDVPR